jgi:hypothetical protein
MNDPVASIAGLAQQELTASVQALALPKGLYVFSVKSADPERVAELGGLMLPAMHIGVGPNVPARAIEFLFAGDEGSPWLYAPGDTLVAKVVDAQVMLFLTSVRRAGAEPLDVEIERLDARHEPDAQAAAVPPRAAPAAQREEPVRLQISAHISNRGDVVFIDTEWVGRLGHGMSIEAFSVTPLDQLAVADIEYKGLTGAGFESPWISNGELCGTRGMGIPLVGFAVRLKPQAAAMVTHAPIAGIFAPARSASRQKTVSSAGRQRRAILSKASSFE